MAVFEPIALRPETLSEKVYGAIREAIVSRRLPPGGRITEASLATQLSVSKTPVREAILRLEHVGLIKADSGKGASVVQASPAIIREAFEYRLAIEVEAARLAAARADEAAMEALEDLAEKSLSAALRGDSAGFSGSDRRFHLAIADAFGNARLSQAVRDVLDLTGALRSRDALDTHNSVACAQAHVQIAAAIRAKSVQETGALIRAHLQTVQDLVVAAFARGAGEREPDPRGLDHRHVRYP